VGCDSFVIEYVQSYNIHASTTYDIDYMAISIEQNKTYTIIEGWHIQISENIFTF